VINSSNLLEKDASHLFQEIRQRLVSRMHRQITDLHIVAYFINPSTITDDQIPGITYHEAITRAHRCLLKYVKQDDRGFKQRTFEALTSGMITGGDKAIGDLLQFRRREGNWNINSGIWRLSSDLTAFWDRGCIISSELGEIALRLVRTPATSVPSERAFSALNLVMSKLRSRLTPEQVDTAHV
jgi:hypothetical protein